MEKSEHLAYEFGPFRLDLEQRILLRDGEPITLAPKVLDTLVLLVKNRGRILEKDELIQALWPESFVEESNLSQNIFVLRKLLGDDRNSNAFIQTVPRRGYRFVAAVREVEATAPGRNLPAADYWNLHSPFRSLKTFESEDAWLFFGRDSETADLLTRLGASPMLTIVGNSGCGKSSLVRAGLIPALRAGRFCDQGTPITSWRIAVFRPSAAPFDYLAEVLPQQLAPQLSLAEQAEFISHCRTKLPESGDSLRNAVSALANASSSRIEQQHTLLVADQFEEIFTLTSNVQVRERYIETLVAAATIESAVPVHVVVVLRADFYAHCLDHPALSRSMEANLFNVARMPQAQMRESIERRLELASVPAEPGLINSLLEDVGTQPGNLALLEHALGQLWDKSQVYPRMLTNQAYAAIGRLRGALGRHADEVYNSLENEEQKRLAQRVFLELVHLGEGAQDTRRRVSKSQLDSLGPRESVERLLVRLISSRLISAGREAEEIFVEVSHEALIREWPALREWIEQNREELVLERRLFHAAQEWESLQLDPGALLRGARLAQAEEWLTRHPDVPSLLRQFVQAGVLERAETLLKERHTQERELAQQKAAAALARRSATRLRWFSSILTVMLLVAVGTAWFAYHLQVMEQSRTLAAESRELLPRDRGQALDLALHSWAVAQTEEAHLAVAKAFPESLASLNHHGPVTTAVFSPDGSQILSASSDHTARLWRVADGELIATLQGHTDTVESAAFSPDGHRIVTASDDMTARVWDSADGRLLFTLKGHSGRVWRAAFSPDGQRIVTASDDHTGRVWASSDGRLLAVLHGHTSTVGTANFSADGQSIVTASWDHTARVWNSADGRLLASLQDDTAVIDAAFSPNNQQIVTAAMGNRARVWGSADGRLLFTLPHNGPVVGAMYSPDGEIIVTASLDHTARAWSSGDGHPLFTLQHDGGVNQVAFSRDGRHIVTASDDHTARIWSRADGRLLAMLEGHNAEVRDAGFAPDGRSVVTASEDHTARVWNTSSGRLLTTLRGHTGYLSYAEFSPDGDRIVTVSQDETARLWGSADGHLVATLQGGPGGFLRAHFSPNGQRIVTAGADHTAQIWNGFDGRLLATLQGHTDTVWQAEFSLDGKRIVTASKDQTARVWDSTDGRLLATLQGHTDKIWQAEFSRDGRRIVTASKDNTARVWNSADGQLIAVLRGHSGPVWRATFSPDARRIVTASYDRTARVWDSSDGRLLATLEGHTDLVDAAEFSPDGQSILTASWDHTVRLWDSADGRLLAILQGHTGKVIDAAFSPDGQRIVTASEDGTARVWRSADGRLLATLEGHTGNVIGAAFSSDGQLILTASFDQTARLWRVLTQDDIEAILSR